MKKSILVIILTLASTLPCLAINKQLARKGFDTTDALKNKSTPSADAPTVMTKPEDIARVVAEVILDSNDQKMAGTIHMELFQGRIAAGYVITKVIIIDQENICRARLTFTNLVDHSRIVEEAVAQKNLAGHLMDECDDGSDDSDDPSSQ